ncbi:MAG: hypothetical protein K0R50_2359 [Eubacterium sp.]|jgi:hypothetical protein|nr:hypothetical protein [Eubacterium sp.]
MMSLNNGMDEVHNTLNDVGKGGISKIEKRYARYPLLGYKILVPEYLFAI